MTKIVNFGFFAKVLKHQNCCYYLGIIEIRLSNNVFNIVLKGLHLIEVKQSICHQI